MENQPEFVVQALEFWNQGLAIAKGWVLSPAAWSQFALLVVAFLAALWVSRRLRPILTKLLTPEEANTSLFAKARRFVLQFVPLLLPLLAFALTGVGENITRSIFGSGAVIAFGKRVFLFLAVRILVKEVVQDPFMKVLGKYLLIPLAGIYALGLLGPVMAKLDATVIPLGNLSFSLLFLARFAIVGGGIFWLGRWSNTQSTAFIKNQSEMRPAMRNLPLRPARSRSSASPSFY